MMAVRDLSLTVGPGETVGIVGESGSGKSTTLSALLGLLPRTAEVEYETLQIIDDAGAHRNVTDPTTLRGRTLGLVPQDPGRALDPLMQIGKNFSELHRHLLHVTDRDESRSRALKTLESVGVDRPELRLQQFPHELSGGLRQRILIALALVAEPRLLLADEPTSNLDTTVQRRVLDLFDQLRADYGLGMLLVTHDLAVAAERADRIVVLRDGQLVETGPAQSIVRAPRHKYTRELVYAQPARLPARPKFRATTPPQIVLEGQGLSKSFDGIAAVEDVSLQLHRGQSIAIVGESGAGKSTLLRLLSGLDRPDTGTVELDGTAQQPRRRRGAALSRAVQIVYQNPASSLNPALQVARIITEPLEAHRVGTSASRARRARELLEQVELPADIADRRPLQLSGGQAQRVAIARALALEPDVVALDEPVSALDQAVQYSLLKLLASLQDTLGIAYLLISHDLGVVRAAADTVIVMRDGHVEEQGTTDEIFTRPRSPYTRTLLDAAPVLSEIPADSPLEGSTI